MLFLTLYAHYANNYALMIATNSSTDIVTALKRLLQTGDVSTQEDIKQALAAQGIIVNQSKISRLLRKVGAIKMVNDQGEAIYSLARDPLPPSTDSPLTGLVLEIDANEVMIVIRTTPGSASIIAHLLDRHSLDLQILGTVAGDDTLFIVPKSVQVIAKLLEDIKKVLGGE